MSSIVEIEAAIARLSREEFVELARWFDEERNRKWDRQIEKDARNGKLRHAYERLQSQHHGEPDVPLDKFFDDEEFS